MKLTLEQKLAHGGHPVLRWMMDNIYIRTDPAGNIKADKEKSTEKIDGAVATIMGLDRAIRCGNNTGASVYSPEGLYPPLCWIILWIARFRNHTVILLEEIKNWKNYIPCLRKTVTFFFAESPASEKVNLPTGKRCTCPDRKYHC